MTTLLVGLLALVPGQRVTILGIELLVLAAGAGVTLLPGAGGGLYGWSRA